MLGSEAKINRFQDRADYSGLLAAVIPAFNEGENIERVIRQVCERAIAIVVDDGSVDDTASKAGAAGAFVIRHPINRGYDAALESGTLRAMELGCLYVVTMDADGQHDPSLLDLFRGELDAGADLVVGVRDRTQRWSEAVFGYVGNLVWGVRDPLCGMKGYRLTMLSDPDIRSSYASIGTELAIRAVKSGFKISQPPVPTHARRGASRFGSGIRANFRIITALLRGLLCTGRLMAGQGKLNGVRVKKS
jgi:glycosyltransferase involved in cell wall biosynthesis